MDVPMQNDQALTRDSLFGTAAESTYAGITSFMRRRYSRDLRGVDVAVSGVPPPAIAPAHGSGRAGFVQRPPGLPGNGTGHGRSTRSIIWR